MLAKRLKKEIGHQTFCGKKKLSLKGRDLGKRKTEVGLKEKCSENHPRSGWCRLNYVIHHPNVK
jgi:hypothetical protein